MFTRCFLVLAVLSTSHYAKAQGIMGDVFSGKLINPEVGVFAWYDLTDTNTGKQFYLRLAIVGEEKIKGKTGHWFEVELVPRVGFPSTYKLLLTGPASDPKNIHRILMKEGNNEEVELDTAALTEANENKDSAKRQALGMDALNTQAGPINAEHVSIDTNGVVSDLWLNNEVRPMGIVKMKSPQGELVLREYGLDAEKSGSMFNKPGPTGANVQPNKNEPENADLEGAESTPEKTDNMVPLENETIAPTTETPAGTAPGAQTAPTSEKATGETSGDTENVSATEEKSNKQNTPRTQRRGPGAKR